MMRLRKYQNDCAAAVNEFKNNGIQRMLVTMPTGTGKTVTFAKILETAFAEGAQRAVVLAHRDELLDQAKRKIEQVTPGLSVGVEAADRHSGPFDDIVVASVQTVGRERSTRLLKLTGANLLIIDEAHHACANSYQIVMDKMGAYRPNSGLTTVGFTATPKRLDNKPLYGEAEAVFEEEAFRYELREAINDGYLCDIRGFRIESDVDLTRVSTRGGDYSAGELERAVDTAQRNALALAAWNAYAKDRKTIVFCTGVNHAKHVAQLFNDSGVPAASVDGSMSKDERRAILQALRENRIKVLCNVEVLTEGFDEPDVACVLMLRPTQSWGMYCQMVGRGTRLLPGVIDNMPLDATPEQRRAAIAASNKPDCIVLDVVDMTGKHDLASVPSLLGLPPKLDLKGARLSEGASLFDELVETGGASQIAKAYTLDDIRRLTQEVNLLQTVQVSEPVKRASNFNWLEMPDESFMLSCGPEPNSNARRMAYLSRDTLGHYVLRRCLRVESNTTWLPAIRVSQDLTQALRDSDRILTTQWSNIAMFASRNARWKNNPATPRQLAALKRLRVPVEQYTGLTAGQAQGLLDRAIERIRARQAR